jgi:hypothetical protein
MKLILIGIAVAILVIVLWSVVSTPPVDSAKTEIGDFSKFAELLSKVMESENPYAFVAISPEGRSEFFQITAD